MLNAGLSPEHEEKLGSCIDGIGLYRTEIPFMLQSGFPSEEEQVAQYQGCCKCSMINPSPCVRWMSEQISSCLTCRFSEEIHAWVGVGFALR